MKKSSFSLLLFILLASCSTGPEKIIIGTDVCAFCKMTIMDERFASQCVSKKGKNFKFDDMHCMATFIHNGGVWSNEIANIYFSDFTKKSNWIEQNKVFILHSEALKSPMGGNFAAFASEADREAAMKQYNGKKITWDQVK